MIKPLEKLMSKVSRAYGKAAFDYASSNQELDKWFKLCEQLDIEHKALSNPTLDDQDLWKAFKHLSLTETQKAWLDLMFESHHAHHLASAAKDFIHRYYKHTGVVPVKVITVKSLTKKDQNALNKKLEKQLGKKVVSEFLVNPDILGGVQFEINDKLIDHSLSLILKQLHTET